jgi:hypothetical protein
VGGNSLTSRRVNFGELLLLSEPGPPDRRVIEASIRSRRVTWRTRSRTWRCSSVEQAFGSPLF